MIDSKTADEAHSKHCARKTAEELFAVGMDRFEKGDLIHRSMSPSGDEIQNAYFRVRS